MRFSRFFFRTVLLASVIVTLFANTTIAKIEIVTDGLVSFWSFDESTIVGDTVRDLWGSNHGTMEEKPEIIDGKFNKALLFDGKANLVEIPHSESLNITEAITIEFWFTKAGKTSDAQPYPRPVSKGQSTVDNGAYGVWVADQPTGQDIGLRSSSGLNLPSGATPDYGDGEWHHVAATYDGEVGKIYLDGEIIADAPAGGGLAETDDPLHIGDGNDERHFNGGVDEVRIYNRALAEEEVLQNFNAKSNSAAVESAGKFATLWGNLKIQ